MKRIVSFFIVTVMLAVSVSLSADAFPVWRGDADGDDKIGTVDAVLLLRKIAGWDIELKDSADFNSDGNINTSDVVNVLRYVAGWDVMNDDLLEATYGVSEISFEIPDPVCTNTVNGKEFGFDTSLEDNAPAFDKASAYLKENPGTRLEIDKGTYRTTKGFYLYGVKDCTIDCGGSDFIFFGLRTFYIFSGCTNVKLCNMTEKWDWDFKRLGSLVRVKSVTEKEDARTMEFEFVYEEDASFALDVTWESLVGLAPETLSARGCFYGMSNHVTNRKCQGNVITADVSNMNAGVGNMFLIRHYNYGPGLFASITGESSGIIFEDVNIYGVPGCGFSIASRSNHVRFTRMTIDLDPEFAQSHRISTTADAMHIKDTLGYFILEDCTIGFSGDDCMNIHDNVGVVEGVDGNTVYMHATNTTAFVKGDTLSFRNGLDYSHLDFTATILDRSVEGMTYTLTLDKDCSELEEGTVVCDSTTSSTNYIVRNCYFHENRARGLLLGSGNGLVENNRFYRIEQQAINLPVDIIANTWLEGAGAENIIIRNNTFDNCNLLGVSDGAMISIFSRNTFNEEQQSGIYGGCFEDILIANNRFINPTGYIFDAFSFGNLTFYGNTISFPGDDYGYSVRSSTGKIKITGDYYDGSHIIGNRWIQSELTPEKVNEFSVRKTKKSKIVIKDNVIE